MEFEWKAWGFMRMEEGQKRIKAEILRIYTVWKNRVNSISEEFISAG